MSWEQRYHAKQEQSTKIIEQLYARIDALETKIERIIGWSDKEKLALVVEYLNDEPSVHRAILEMIGAWDQ
tara:strand:+ start:169 stop:381 length:213 start_codon:yes stop_codon:yes gene_type:complete